MVWGFVVFWGVGGVVCFIVWLFCVGFLVGVFFGILVVVTF